MLSRELRLFPGDRGGLTLPVVMAQAGVAAAVLADEEALVFAASFLSGFIQHVQPIWHPLLKMPDHRSLKSPTLALVRA